LGSYEDRNEDWYGFENKEEKEQVDTSHNETQRHPTFSITRHSRIECVAKVVEAVNGNKAQRQLGKIAMSSGRGVYLALYRCRA